MLKGLKQGLKALLLHIIASLLAYNLLIGIAKQLGEPSSNINNFFRHEFWDAPERPVVFPLLPQWKHVLEDHKTRFPPFPPLHSLLRGKPLDGMLCRTLVAAQPNSFSRPGLPPRCSDASPGGAFKSPLPPRPPAEERQAEQGDSGNKYSRPDNGGPAGRGWCVDCIQK